MMRGITEIFADVVDQSSALLRKEAALARAEMSEKISGGAVGLGLIVGGSVLLTPALVILLQRPPFCCLASCVLDMRRQAAGQTCKWLTPGCASTGRGRLAKTPSEIPARGWKDVLLRIYQKIGGAPPAAAGDTV